MIWNVSVLFKGCVTDYQFEGNNVIHVHKQAEHLLVGEIIKIALAEYDNN